MAENNKDYAPVAASLNLDDERVGISDAEIAGIMGWRGPGVYSGPTLRKIKRVIEEDRARRTPPAEVSADTLPALTEAQMLAALASITHEVPARLPPGWAKFARAIEAKVRAPYAEQIKKLERELAERKQVQSIGSIEDYAQFHTLLGSWMGLRHHYQDDSAPVVLEAWRKFIAYIDARPAGTAPEGYVLVPKKLPPEVVDAIARASYDLDDTAREIVREDWACSLAIIAEFAAAPSLSTGTEESK